MPPLARTRLLRLRRAVPATAALVALSLAACGTAREPATLLGTAPVTGQGGAPATTVAGVPPTSRTPRPTIAVPAPGAAPTTTATVATPVSPADTAGTAVTTAPTATTATGAPGTPAPAPGGAGSAPVDEGRVALVFERLGYALTAEERACMVTVVSPETLAALEGGGDNALVGAVTSNFVMALATCEPLTFVLEQDTITMEDYGVDATGARCVTLALNAAARADPAVALAYYEGTNLLPPAGQQALIDALTPCVGAAKAREIITT